MPPSGRLKEAQLRALLAAPAVDIGSAVGSLKSCRGSMLNRSQVTAKDRWECALAILLPPAVYASIAIRFDLSGVASGARTAP